MCNLYSMTRSQQAVHTNGMENFWHNFKFKLRGTHSARSLIAFRQCVHAETGRHRHGVDTSGVGMGLDSPAAAPRGELGH
jgi:hypothetical protein